MSTKTSIKRIALVAVSALGFGLLSVVPSSAASVQATWAYGTLPTTNAAVGSTITVPVTFAATTTGTQSVGDKWIVKAHLSTMPTNAAALFVTTTSSAASAVLVDNTVTAAAGTGNTSTTGASLTVTNDAAETQAAAVAGSFSFVPPTAGYYVMTLTATVLDSDPAGTDSPTATITDATVEFNVSGGSLVQASTGLGTSSGTQVAGRSSAANFCLPLGSTAASRYQIAATGATITDVKAGASKADAVNATSYTSATGVTQNTPNSYATGVTYTGLATVVNAHLTTLVTDCVTVAFTSDVASAATVTVKDINLTTGVLTTVGSVTVEFGAVRTVSPSLSLVYIGQGNVRPTAAETTAIRLPSTAGVALSSTATSGATIRVDVKDTAGNALVNQAITATISGPGLITLANGTGTGSTGTVRTASLTATTMASSSEAVIGVSADGTRGVGTITITAGGVTIATKTVTFYGAVASLTATQNVSVVRSGRTATSTVSSYTLGGTDATVVATSAVTRTTLPAVTIVAKDADGNVVPALTLSAVIADSTVLSDVTITDCTGGGSTTVCAAGAGNWISSVTSAIGGVSGKSTTVTYRVANPAAAGTWISTAAVPFTLGGTTLGGTVTMKLDKATYAPGERMVITYTAKDAAGNPVMDWTALTEPSANKNVVGLAGPLFFNGADVIGDEAGEYVYAPTTPGAFTLTLATGTATGAEITATATVSDDASTAAANAASDAAAEAIDAANAATDAANLAAEAADAATVAAEEARDAADAATAAVEELATQVATLMAALKAQITTLANTVAKIAKKVKA